MWFDYTTVSIVFFPSNTQESCVFIALIEERSLTNTHKHTLEIFYLHVCLKESNDPTQSLELLTSGHDQGPNHIKIENQNIMSQKKFF